MSRKSAIAYIASSSGIIIRRANVGNTLTDGEKKKWQSLLEACDKPAYSVVPLDKLGEEINNSIASGIKKIYNSLKEITGSIIDPENSYQARTAKVNKIKAFYNISKYSGRKEDLQKEAISFGDIFGKGMMGIGIITDLILFGKNLYETYENGKKLLYSLPLQKWGIDNAAIPLPNFVKENGKKLETLIKQNKESPEALSELLEISKTLKAYSSDFIGMLANTIYLFLDVVDLAVAAGSAMVLKPLTGWVNLLLALPIIGYEIANETIVEESFGSPIDLIKNICGNHLYQESKSEEYSETQTNKSERYITMEDIERLRADRALKTMVN